MNERTVYLYLFYYTIQKSKSQQEGMRKSQNDKYSRQTKMLLTVYVDKLKENVYNLFAIYNWNTIPLYL